MSRPRVVVVGGGLAGLAAALDCADGGAGVLLLEARSRLGGLTFSFRRDGLWVDNGQHVFLRCFSAYRRFLSRIGADAGTVIQDRMTIPVLSPTGRRARLRRNGLPAPLHLAGALARYGHLPVAERVRAARAALALRRLEPGTEQDRLTFGAWLAARAQSPAAVQGLWDLIALPALNLPSREASLFLAAMVFRTGLLTERTAGDIGWATVPLADLHAEPAVRALGLAGAEVRPRTPVRRLEVGDAHLEVVGEAGRWPADAVILAVPHDAAGDLLPPGALSRPERLAELGTSPIVNVHVVLDRRVMDVPFAAAVGSPIQWVFDRTGPSGLAEGQYLVISLSGAEREATETTEVLGRIFVPALGDLFPAVRDARVRALFVTREQRATFRQAPGTAALRPRTETALPRLFLAGAWTDTGWPATMEGAVRSGLAAARAALTAVGRERGVPAEVAA